MLASLADAPLDDPHLVYEPKYDGIRAIAEIEPGGSRAAVVAARQREDAPVSRDRRGAGTVGAQAQGTARARRRDRRARREGRADRLSAAPGSHSPVGRRCRSERPAVQPAHRLRSHARRFGERRRRVHRLRHPARRPRPTCAIGRCRAPRGARARVRHSTGSPLLRISDQFAATARALYKQALERGLGRADRQARRLALQVGQAHARLAQAEDRPRAGVRHRRLDRAAADARLFRRAAARRLRGRPSSSTSATPAPASTSASSRA